MRGRLYIKISFFYMNILGGIIKKVMTIRIAMTNPIVTSQQSALVALGFFSIVERILRL